MTASKQKLVSMLTYMRPAYSITEQIFCEKYLLPIFGEPDEHGNYIKVIGDRPNIAFTAHTDTVHKIEGIQKLSISNDVVTTMTGSCLGADCTTGVWLLLGMIEAGVEGVYIAHAAEEIGGVGSTNLVKDYPAWLIEIDAVISFDRFDTCSIITHQGGMRTASDDFAKSLAGALELPQLKPDSYGTYTDSMEYAEIVSECTNISVGYYNQHTAKESQDLEYAEMLLERLIEADWSALVLSRDQTVVEYTGGSVGRYSEGGEDDAEVAKIWKLLLDRPSEVAELLYSYGFTMDDMCDELDLDLIDRSFYTDVATY